MKFGVTDKTAGKLASGLIPSPLGAMAMGVGTVLAGVANAVGKKNSQTKTSGNTGASGGGQSTASSAKGVNPDYSAGYMEARAAGDWQTMQMYNDLKNAERKANGEAPQYATDDIELIRRQSEEKAQQAQQTQPGYNHSTYLRKEAAGRLESELAGLKGAYDSSMAEYDAALEMLPQRYQGYRNDAAAQSAMAQKNFDERATASGLNSGASGQAALDASAVYRGTLAQLNQAQANGLAEFDRDKANLTARYETAVAQARANGDADLAQALYQELIRVEGIEEQRRQEADTKALNSALTLAGQGNYYKLGEYYGWDAATTQYMNEMWWNAKKKAEHDEAVAQAQWMANNMISKGIMPPTELLVQAGYSTQYAQLLSEARAEELARLNGGR